jgi:hypothetical protein
LTIIHIVFMVSPDELYIHMIVHLNKFLFYNQPDALIIQIYSVIKLYMFPAFSLPIIRSFLLYILHWKRSSNLHETCQCQMYSRKLLMMGREDTRNM